MGGTCNAIPNAIHEHHRQGSGHTWGTPVFQGTRVPFQALLDYLEGGETLDDFLDVSQRYRRMPPWLRWSWRSRWSLVSWVKSSRSANRYESPAGRMYPAQVQI